MASPSRTQQEYNDLLHDILGLLSAACRTAVRAINTVMTVTYWEVGRRIVEREQGGNERAGYGEEVMKRLATDLSKALGRGFSLSNLKSMRQFYLVWPPTRGEEQKGQSTYGQLRAQHFQLPWSNYVTLLGVESDAARAFYEREVLVGG